MKQLSHDGRQGFQEFVTEVLMLSLLHDSNLVKLIGYCTDGDQRLLVYEYMPMGSLEDHLFGNLIKPLLFCSVLSPFFYKSLAFFLLLLLLLLFSFIHLYLIYITTFFFHSFICVSLVCLFISFNLKYISFVFC